MSNNLSEITKPDQPLEVPPPRNPAAKAVTTATATKVGNLLQNDVNPLLDAERKELFAGLHTTLKRKENCEGAPDISVIEAALIKNPTMMRNLWRLQKAGAKLVVTSFEKGQHIEFADAAQNLGTRKQETVLAGLTEQERNGAIEKILDPITDDTERASAKKWLLAQLDRPNNARGLNYVEALVYAVAHCGLPISHNAYKKIAKRDPNIEDDASSWYCIHLSTLLNGNYGASGYRRKGKAVGGGVVTSCRTSGARVAGLRVNL